MQVRHQCSSDRSPPLGNGAPLVKRGIARSSRHQAIEMTCSSGSRRTWRPVRVGESRNTTLSMSHWGRSARKLPLPVERWIDRDGPALVAERLSVRGAAPAGSSGWTSELLRLLLDRGSGLGGHRVRPGLPEFRIGLDPRVGRIALFRVDGEELRIGVLDAILLQFAQLQRSSPRAS